jgi:hypothetical protein
MRTNTEAINDTVTSQSSATKRRVKRAYQTTASNQNSVWAAVDHGHYDKHLLQQPEKDGFAQTRTDGLAVLQCFIVPSVWLG